MVGDIVFTFPENFVLLRVLLRLPLRSKKCTFYRNLANALRRLNGISRTWNARRTNTHMHRYYFLLNSLYALNQFYANASSKLLLSCLKFACFPITCFSSFFRINYLLCKCFTDFTNICNNYNTNYDMKASWKFLFTFYLLLSAHCTH